MTQENKSDTPNWAIESFEEIIYMVHMNGFLEYNEFEKIVEKLREECSSLIFMNFNDRDL